MYRDYIHSVKWVGQLKGSVSRNIREQVEASLKYYSLVIPGFPDISQWRRNKRTSERVCFNIIIVGKCYLIKECRLEGSQNLTFTKKIGGYTLTASNSISL